MKKEFLDLGKQPIAKKFLYANDMENEYFFDLKVGFDDNTKLVSLMNFVDPNKLFNNEYTYRGSLSMTMRNHFQYLSDVMKRQKEYGKILEIGSNDGVFIRNHEKENIIAVEPCSNLAKETNELGYKTYSEFWTPELSDKIKSEHGEQDIIFSANTMCRIPDILEAFGAVTNIMHDESVFIFEDPSLFETINRGSYDQFYDEHAHLFSIISLKNLLGSVGLRIYKVEQVSVHGGSNRIYACKVDSKKLEDVSVQNNITLEKILQLDFFGYLRNWAIKIDRSRIELKHLILLIKTSGKKIVSYGASSKSSTVFNYCGINTDLIEYITDTTPEKQGKLSPGVHIPVVDPSIAFNDTVDFAYLGAWNFMDEILNKEKKFVNRGGRFITHVPLVKIV